MTSATAERTAKAGAWLGELHGLAREWVAAQWGAMGTARTGEYVDLLFAFGRARLGQVRPAQQLLSQASCALQGDDEAHHALLEAFRFRIEQALRGEPHRGPLPKAWYEHLEAMERLARYVVDRLRKHSRTLEPDQHLNPYRHWGARISDFEAQLAALQEYADPPEFVARADELRRRCPEDSKGKEMRTRVLREALSHASLATAQATRDWLSEAIPSLQREPIPTEELAALMEWAAFAWASVQAATHHRLREEFLQAVQVVPRFVVGPAGASGGFLGGLLSACVRGFIAFRLPDELDSFLGELTPQLTAVSQGSEVGRLCLTASLAEGWYAFGWVELARPVLKQALDLLPSLAGREVDRLACAAVSALRAAPADEARAYYLAVLDRSRTADAYTTATHFTVSQLDVIEAIVLSATEAFLND